MADQLTTTLLRLIQEKENIAYAKGRKDTLASLVHSVEQRIRIIDDGTTDIGQLDHPQTAKATRVPLTLLEEVTCSPCPRASYEKDWADAMSAFRIRVETRVLGNATPVSAADVYLILQDLYGGYEEEGRNGWYDALNTIGDCVDSLVGCRLYKM